MRHEGGASVLRQPFRVLVELLAFRDEGFKLSLSPEDDMLLVLAVAVGHGTAKIRLRMDPPHGTTISE